MLNIIVLKHGKGKSQYKRNIPLTQLEGSNVYFIRAFLASNGLHPIHLKTRKKGSRIIIVRFFVILYMTPEGKTEAV